MQCRPDNFTSRGGMTPGQNQMLVKECTCYELDDKEASDPIDYIMKISPSASSSGEFLLLCTDRVSDMRIIV